MAIECACDRQSPVDVLQRCQRLDEHVIAFARQYGSNGEDLQRRAGSRGALCRIGSGFGDRDFFLRDSHRVDEDAFRDAARDDDVTGVLKRDFLARFDFDFAAVGQAGFEEQRMMNERDDAARKRIEDVARKRSERQAIDHKHFVTRLGFQQAGRFGEIARARIGVRIGERENRHANAEVGQQFDHAPVIGVAAGRAFQIAGYREDDISH